MSNFQPTKYPHIEVSDMGEVRNVNTGKLVKQTLSRSNGYYKVSIYLGNRKTKIIEVHRLVAETFHPNTVPGLVVDHIDGNKHNNCASNLQFITRSQNMLKSHRTGIRNPALTQAQIDDLLDMRKAGKSWVQVTIEMNEKYGRSTGRQTYTSIARKQ